MEAFEEFAPRAAEEFASHAAEEFDGPHTPGDPFDLLTMGRIGMDLCPLQTGVPPPQVESFGKFLGGSATNLAVAAARLGRRTAVITRTGDDPFDTYLHEALRGFGIDEVEIATGERDPHTHMFTTGDSEWIVLSLEGAGTVHIEDKTFQLLGRDNVFAGVTDFAYVPRVARVQIASGAGGRFALAGAKCERRLPARYGPAPEVPVARRSRPRRLPRRGVADLLPPLLAMFAGAGRTSRSGMPRTAPRTIFEVRVRADPPWRSASRAAVGLREVLGRARPPSCGPRLQAPRRVALSARSSGRARSHLGDDRHRAVTDRTIASPTGGVLLTYGSRSVPHTEGYR